MPVIGVYIFAYTGSDWLRHGPCLDENFEEIPIQNLHHWLSNGEVVFYEKDIRSLTPEDKPAAHFPCLGYWLFPDDEKEKIQEWISLARSGRFDDACRKFGRYFMGRGC